MKRLIAKYILIMLAIAISIVGMIGCKTETETSVKGSEAKGRYVETRVELPSEFQDMYIMQMEKGDDGYPVIYTFNKDRTKKGAYKYSKKESGEWEKSPIKWLGDINIPRVYDNKLIFGPNGGEYFIYREEKADGHLGKIHLLKKVDENRGEDVKLEGWDTLDLKADMPLSINILKNGNILCFFNQQHITIYNKDNYKIISDTPYNDGSVTIYGEDFIAFTGHGDKKTEGSVSFYDSNAKLVDKIKFDITNATKDINLSVNSDNSIIMTNTDGINVLDPKTKIWETVVDGSLTTFNSPSLHPDTVIEGKDKIYYGLFRNETGGVQLMKYYYDKMVLAKPEKELSVYALEDNLTVREGIIAFQRKNPNIKVNFRFSMDEESEANKTEYIKSLNTELLSGNGADLIILDDLPVNSYIEKGGLADISDIINPMINSNELSKNIMSNYIEGDKIYSVPLKYGVSAIYGNTKVVNSASNLDDLVNYTINHKGEKVFGKISYSDLMRQFLPMHITDFYDNKGTINKEELVRFLDKMKKISDDAGAIEKYSDSEKKSDGFFSLASDSKVVLSNTKGIFDSMGCISAVEYVKGSFTPYEGAFTSIGEVGINASSKKIDLAKEFIKILLSTEVQDEDFVDGFPINNKSLENRYNCHDYGLINIMSVQNADGTTSDFNVTWPKKERLDFLMDMCRKASKKTINNNVLFGIIIGETDDFFKDKKTTEETAEAILNETKMYLSA